MKNLVFVIWMVGYSFSVTLSHYVSWKIDKKYKPDEQVAIVVIIIWFAVGIMLWE